MTGSGTPGPLGPVPDLSRHRLRVLRAPHDVHLYLMPLEQVTDPALTRADLLDPADHTRAAHLGDPGARHRLLASRVLARVVVAHHAGVPAEHVTLTHDPATGAPHVALHSPSRESAKETAGGGWYLSVSRTERLVAVVIAHRPVGVDVERIQSTREAEALTRVLNPRDGRALRRRRPGRWRNRTVTEAWTRVEALLKLRGTGLATDPARVRVCGGLRPVRPAPGVHCAQPRLRQCPDHVLALVWRDGPVRD